MLLSPGTPIRFKADTYNGSIWVPKGTRGTIERPYVINDPDPQEYMIQFARGRVRAHIDKFDVEAA